MKLLLVAFVVTATVYAEKKPLATADRNLAESIGCTICQAGMSFLKKEAPTIAGFVKSFINQQCDKLMGFADICKQLTGGIIDAGMNILEKGDTSMGMCQSIRLCDGGMLRKGPNNNFCAQVKIVYEQVDNTVAMLHDGCILADNAVTIEQCRQMVDANRVIVADIAKISLRKIARVLPYLGQDRCELGDPAQFAAEEAAGMDAQMFTNLIEASNRADGILCGICETVLGFVKSNLLGGATEDLLLNQVKLLCNNIPGADTQAECIKVIDTFGREIFETIRNLMKPRDICALVQACDTPKLLSN